MLSCVAAVSPRVISNVMRPNQMSERHHDDGSTVYSFAEHFLVECPRCEKCAKTSRIGRNGHITLARIVCTSCGYSKDREINGWYVGLPEDWYFQLPLWLQRSCCGKVLWAYNLDHLAYIESYVGADHRLRNPDPSATIRNATMASRLPRWMIDSKNRRAVMQAIKALREKAAA